MKNESPRKRADQLIIQGSKTYNYKYQMSKIHK